MVILKIGNNEIKLFDKKVQSLVIAFADKKRQIDALNKELSVIREGLIDTASKHKDSAKSVQLLLDNDGVKITFGDELKITNVTKLRKLLGEEFDTYTNTTVKAKSGLRPLWNNNAEVNKCMSLVAKTPTVALVKV